MADTLLNSVFDILHEPRGVIGHTLVRTWFAALVIALMVVAFDLFDPGIVVLPLIVIGPGVFTLLVAYVAIRDRKKLQFAMGLLCALLIGGGADLVAEQQYRKRQDFLANARHAEGFVLEDYERKYPWGMEYYLKYRFTIPADGALDPKQVIAESPVRARRYQRAPEGTLVPVRYDPRDPTQAEIDVNEESELLPYVDAVVAAFLLGLILACEAISILHRWSSRRPVNASET